MNIKNYFQPNKMTIKYRKKRKEILSKKEIKVTKNFKNFGFDYFDNKNIESGYNKYLNDGRYKNLRYRSEMFAEGHNRLATGFLPLTFCALALAILLNGSFNRRGHTILIVKALGGVFMVLFLSLTLKNYAVTHQWLLPLMYCNTIIPLLIALYIILKPNRFPPPRQYDIPNTIV